jgi:hypothetical protein
MPERDDEADFVAFLAVAEEPDAEDEAGAELWASTSVENDHAAKARRAKRKNTQRNSILQS